MQILFLDESGTPPKPGQPEPRYFVIAGVIVPESVWHKLRDALIGMKIRRKIRGELKWRYFSPSNDDARNPLRHLEQAERDSIRAELYRIITNEPSVKSLAGICSSQAAYAMASVNDQQGIYNLTYKVVTERFQYFLQDLKRETGREEYGLVIADHRGRDDDKRLRAHHQMLVHSTTAFTSKYGNLIESLLLQPSNLSVGIQLADIVAGAFGGNSNATMRSGFNSWNRPSGEVRRDRQMALELLKFRKLDGFEIRTPSETLVPTCIVTHSRRGEIWQ